MLIKRAAGERATQDLKPGPLLPSPAGRELRAFVQIGKRLLGDSIRVVVELGARDCRETASFAALLPQAGIWAFECNPDTLPLCRHTVQGLSTVHLIESAVADKCGHITFHKIDPSRTRTIWPDGNPGASSLFQASGKYPVEGYRQVAVTVPAVTLEQFVEDHDIEEIDLLWMDIQGAELMALRSLGPYLRRVKLIHAEVEFIEIYRGQPLYADVTRFLTLNGFRLRAFTTFGRYSADAVFVSRVCEGSMALPEGVIFRFYQVKFLMRRALVRVARLWEEIWPKQPPAPKTEPQ